MRVDLHNHTIYSDGIDDINSLAKKAIENNVDIFAITDHDTINGLKHIPSELENKIILGVELSTKYNGEHVHIVGLFKNRKIGKDIIDYSANFLQKRVDRAVLMMNKIKEIYGLKIDLNSLLVNSNGKSITRGNMLRNIMQANNMSMEEAAFYISNDSKAYIPASKMHPKDGIKLLHDSNAIAILAHPTLLKKETFKEVIEMGFDGIEAYYPLNKEDEADFYKAEAAKRCMFISAGSDCHGDKSHANIGTSCLNEEEFSKIADILGYDVKVMTWK